MKISVIGGLLAAGALVLAALSATATQSQPTRMPGGMIGAAGMGGGFWPGAQLAMPLSSLNAARQAFQAYVDRTGNQDMAVDKAMQFQWNNPTIVQEKSTVSGA